MHTKQTYQTQQSKLANILFTRELDQRLRAKGLDGKVKKGSYIVV